MHMVNSLSRHDMEGSGVCLHLGEEEYSGLRSEKKK